jgi:3-carboxy-cis,cis-muconate cycloisomerase
VARDGFAEAVNLLALVTGSLGKIALDIYKDFPYRVKPL